MNYNSILKTWGATGTEYPDAYSYKKDESPVDEWDNYFAYNVVKDLEHLIDVTNNDLLLRNGGSLLSDLDVAGFSLNGDAGNVDFGGTEITVGGTLDVLQSISIGGNITLGSTGTVDGVNVSDHASNNSAHHTRYADSEAVSAINGETTLSVDVTGDADTLDGFHASELGLSIEEDGVSSVDNSTGIDFTGHLNVTDDGDGTVTIDPTHYHDGRYSKLFVGVQNPVFATLADVPSSIGEGEQVYIQGEGVYVEDGT